VCEIARLLYPPFTSGSRSRPKTMNWNSTADMGMDGTAGALTRHGAMAGTVYAMAYVVAGDGTAPEVGDGHGDATVGGVPAMDASTTRSSTPKNSTKALRSRCVGVC
jgi:hypothetical protein